METEHLLCCWPALVGQRFIFECVFLGFLSGFLLTPSCPTAAYLCREQECISKQELEATKVAHVYTSRSKHKSNGNSITADETANRYHRVGSVTTKISIGTNAFVGFRRRSFCPQEGM